MRARVIPNRPESVDRILSQLTWRERDSLLPLLQCGRTKLPAFLPIRTPFDFLAAAALTVSVSRSSAYGRWEPACTFVLDGKSYAGARATYKPIVDTRYYLPRARGDRFLRWIQQRCRCGQTRFVSRLSGGSSRRQAGNS